MKGDSRDQGRIEALVWLTGVAGLSREEATDLMRWPARALLQDALAERSPAAHGSRATA